MLSLSGLLDLSADTPMGEWVRQSFNSCFAKCDFKNKLSDFCTKSALFTVGQVEQEAFFSNFQHMRDDAVLYFQHCPRNVKLVISLIFFSHATILVMGWSFVESGES